jgi:hypothetical protein
MQATKIGQCGRVHPLDHMLAIAASGRCRRSFSCSSASMIGAITCCRRSQVGRVARVSGSHIAGAQAEAGERGLERDRIGFREQSIVQRLQQIADGSSLIFTQNTQNTQNSPRERLISGVPGVFRVFRATTG